MADSIPEPPTHLDTDADRAEFARAGQQAPCTTRQRCPSRHLLSSTDRASEPGWNWPWPATVGLPSSGPDSAIGFPDAARGSRLVGAEQLGWSDGSAGNGRPHSFNPDHVLSGREAVRIGLFDDAFCERRAKIELRTGLDRIQRTGTLPDGGLVPAASVPSYRNSAPFGQSGMGIRPVAEAIPGGRGGCERSPIRTASPPCLFGAWELAARTRPIRPPIRRSASLGIGRRSPSELAGRAALRGGRVLVSRKEQGLIPPLDEYLIRQCRRGFVTPSGSRDRPVGGSYRRRRSRMPHWSVRAEDDEFDGHRRRRR